MNNIILKDRIKIEDEDILNGLLKKILLTK